MNKRQVWVVERRGRDKWLLWSAGFTAKKDGEQDLKEWRFHDGKHYRLTKYVPEVEK